ncbi:MarR family winged helix-turn-helix transcriptional regulator [Cupriavidus sp. 30B13]|uniref:MarR family winged helix-turn-helix transcriptional regulator n=1 Tax=Cupriavidus sp. 30B13 TaxID=3384241 RepID=UPI003B90A1BC
MTSSPDVPEVSPCNCTAMRKASRRLSQMYDNALAPTGLKSTQYSILAEIKRHGEPPTMRELADAMVMDRSTLGHNLGPLERDGLVELAASATDRRSKHVVLTARGRARIAEARRLWQAAQKRFEQRFGAAQAAALRAVLLDIAADETLVNPA